MANGINPVTNEILAEDDIVNNIKVTRCLFYVSSLLADIINENNGKAAAENAGKSGFAITKEQLSAISVPDEPIGLTRLMKNINSAVKQVSDGEMEKLHLREVLGFMVDKGLLYETPLDNGKTRHIPSDAGRNIGIVEEERNGLYGKYEAVLYSPAAQRYIIEHIPDIKK